MSHYFESPTSDPHLREVPCHIWGRDYTFTSSDSVFSATRLDLGTAVLFRETVPPRHARTLLDLGCGFGPITVALATECPDARVDAVDVNERALALTTRNAEQYRVADRVRVLRPEDADPQTRYDEIWSNPPIRIGKQALHDLLLTWLPRLEVDGVARLVVGKFLGADSLQRWLESEGWACRRTASAKGYRIFEVSAASTR